MSELFTVRAEPYFYPMPVIYGQPDSPGAYMPTEWWHLSQYPHLVGVTFNVNRPERKTIWVFERDALWEALASRQETTSQYGDVIFETVALPTNEGDDGWLQISLRGDNENLAAFFVTMNAVQNFLIGSHSLDDQPAYTRPSTDTIEEELAVERYLR